MSFNVRVELEIDEILSLFEKQGYGNNYTLDSLEELMNYLESNAEYRYLINLDVHDIASNYKQVSFSCLKFIFKSIYEKAKSIYKDDDIKYVEEIINDRFIDLLKEETVVLEVEEYEMYVYKTY